MFPLNDAKHMSFNSHKNWSHETNTLIEEDGGTKHWTINLHFHFAVKNDSDIFLSLITCKKNILPPPNMMRHFHLRSTGHMTPYISVHDM